MRDIRFRAWNEATKTMIDLHKITPLALNMDTGGLFIPFSDALHLMQYTGLEDKNGKEIYEGDIIKTLYVFSSDIPHGQIKFKEGRFFVEWINKDEEMNDILHIHAKASEIIGNIYENPELLKNAEK